MLWHDCGIVESDRYLRKGNEGVNIQPDRT